MKPHACTLQYAPAGRNEFIVQRTECKYCAQNKNKLKGMSDPQLHQHFIRTGPGLVALDTTQNSEQTRPAEIKIEFSKHREKLSRVLKELKISEIDAPEETKHELIALIERCLDAFAADDDDVGETSLVQDTIV